MQREYASVSARFAAFAMDGVITGQDSFDAVEVFSLYCKLKGYVNTIKQKRNNNGYRS